jgi:hypothetical protein
MERTVEIINIKIGENTEKIFSLKPPKDWFRRTSLEHMQ